MKTIVEKITGKVLYASISSVLLKENEVLVDELLTDSFVIPFYNFETKEFYEGATQEEIAEANKQQVPFAVSKRQLKQALFLSGVPLENIDLAIDQIEDETQRVMMQLFWRESNEFERNHPSLIGFSQSLGMSEEQADNIFILANTL